MGGSIAGPLRLPELDDEAIAEFEDNAGEIRPSRSDALLAQLARGEVVDSRVFFDVLDAEESERRFFELAPDGRLTPPDEVTLRYAVARFGDRLLPLLERWAVGGEGTRLLASWGSERAAAALARGGDDRRAVPMVGKIMATDAFEVDDLIPAAPEAIFDAWISPDGHATMTGAEASGGSEVGASFSAWGGYITGTHVELTRPSAIVQEWRTSSFPEDAGPSRVEISLAATNGGTRVSIRHSEIPEGQGVNYEQGWTTHYFDPMKKHFG